MKGFTGRLLRITAVTALLAVAGAVAAAVNTGEPAPDFALPELAGDNLRLSEFRSEVVVLTFWADWCKKCRQVIPVFQSLQAQDSVNVLAVEVDGDATVAETLRNQYGIEFPMLLDQQHQVSRLYKLGRLPMTVVVDQEGNVIYVDKGMKSEGRLGVEQAVAGALSVPEAAMAAATQD